MDLPDTQSYSPPPVSQQPQKHKKLFMVIGLLLILVASVLLYNQFFGKVTRSVTVVGTGEKTVPADSASVTYVVLLSGSDRNNLVAVGESKMADISNNIRQFNPTSYTQTPYQITPQYNRTDGVADASSIRGFQYASGGEVKVNGIQNIAALQQILLDRDATIAQIRYFPQNKEDVDREVRELAIQNAREKASQLARASGARLGRILTIAEQGSNSQTGAGATSTNDQSSSGSTSDVNIQSAVTTTFEVW